MGFFDKIKQGLTKTKTKMDAQLTGIFAAYAPGDEEFFEDLEETLILADTGVETTTKAIAQLRKAIELKKLTTGAEVKKEFVQILTRILKVQDTMLLLTTQPSVVLVVGVNGVGKTTTIGKLASQLKKEGNRVLLSAADTFRAAAADQLTVWAQRAGVEIVKHEEGSDPAAVVFDSIQAAKARGVDVVIIDTAGRLHNKANLMNELNKITRVIRRELPEADIETHGARCHDRSERPHSGQAVSRHSGSHRHRAHKARRHGQGRHRLCDRKRSAAAGEICRRR